MRKKKSFFKLNEKGISMDLDVPLFIILLLSTIAICLDTFMLIPRMNALSEASSYAIKAVEKQGGVAPSEFLHLNQETFTTSETLIKNVNNMLANAGYDTSKTEIRINNNVVTSTSTIGPYNYGEEIKVSVTGTFPYKFSNKINPDFNQTVTTDKIGISMYLIRNN